MAMSPEECASFFDDSTNPAEREAAVHLRRLAALQEVCAEKLGELGAMRRENARLQIAVDVAFCAMRDSAYVGGPSMSEAWQAALGALSAVVTQYKSAREALEPVEGAE